MKSPFYKCAGLLCGLALCGPTVALAQGGIDLDVLSRIRDEGFHHSRVGETLEHMTDVIGPRLTASPGMKKAHEWAARRLEGWGLANVHTEGFEFGRGWQFSRAAVHMLSPQAKPLDALPRAWTSGTDGPQKGAAILADIEDASDFARFTGKLKGKIVFLDEPAKVSQPNNKVFQRRDAKDLAEVSKFPVPGDAVSDFRRRFGKRWLFTGELYAFLAREGVLAAVRVTNRQGKLLDVTGYTYKPGEAPSFPVLVMSMEHYNRVLRLLAGGTAVEMEVDVAAQFDDSDSKAYNLLAEIPGQGKNPEIVMAGAHFDSWHSGTGAVDNGAGSAVVMEAMRILRQLGVKPKRTIRMALWAGEEQGLLGSKAYVARHLASRPEVTDPAQKALPEFLREDKTWPISPGAEFERFSVYFNIDNGSGKIRGIYGEENVAARPVFQGWFRAFRDLDAGTITMRRTGGTDHMSFDAVGLPGFQFVQDRLDYGPRLHHTDIDVYDHAVIKDLKQASVIMASFLYDAAMAEKRFPRKTLPVAPRASEKAKREKDKAEALRAAKRKAKRDHYWKDDK